MQAIIEKSKLSGRVYAPSSKSQTIRALVAAAMAKGQSCLQNALIADDTRAAIEVLQKLGASISHDGLNLTITGGNLKATAETLNCRDSAATLRFMAAICGTLDGKSTLLAGGSLVKRPLAPLLETLEKMGARCASSQNTLIIHGAKLKGGSYRIDGDQSSQFISALLIACPTLDEDVVLLLNSSPRSRPYIDMTIDTLNTFGIHITKQPDFRRFTISPQGYQPADIKIEGDWSSASYLLAMGALDGELEIKGLNLSSLQADRVILAHLTKMGAVPAMQADSICIKASRLKAFTANLKHSIDLLPTMAILAAMADGTSTLQGIARARLKESNRVKAVCQGLEQCGIKTQTSHDSLVIHGGQPNGALVNSFGDHRIAMAFAVLGLNTGNMTITNPGCVAKTFPSFWQTLIELGGKVRLTDG